MSATPLAAADEPICANCWDGPEMFEHRRDQSIEPVVDAVSAISIGVFPERATAAYLELRALTTEQLEKLVRESQESF